MDLDDVKLLTDIVLVDQRLQIGVSSVEANSNETPLSVISQGSEVAEQGDGSASGDLAGSSTPNDLNSSCQEILKKIEKRLLELLGKNRKEQKILLKYLNESNKKTETVEKNICTLVKCAGIPYFKDFHGYPQPRNDDVLEKLANGELCCTDYFTTSHVWSKHDKECVKSAVLKNYSSTKELPQESTDNSELTVKTESVKEARNSTDNIDWLKISVTDLNGKYSATECEAQWKLHLSPDVNKSKWSESEIEKLSLIAKKHKYQDWDGIASELGTQRTGYQCCIQYQTKNSLNEGKWLPEEDAYLKELVEKFKRNDHVSWTKVSWYFQTRSRKQCQERYLEHLNIDLKKGCFSAAEDKIIISGVKIFKDFGKIAKFLPGRVPTQIRSRYYYLIGTSMSEFTKEEDELLVALAKRHPRQWLKISENFESRSKLQCRKRFSALCKQKYPDKITSAVAELWAEFGERKENKSPGQNMGNETGGSARQHQGKGQRSPKKPRAKKGAHIRAPKDCDAYNEILRYHETCSENYFGPRMRHPESTEELNELCSKIRATMAMLSVSCDFSDKSDLIASLTQDPNFDHYDAKILNQLSEEDKSNSTKLTDHCSLKGALIPPNSNTLVGLNTLMSNRSKMKGGTCEAEGLPTTWIGRRSCEPEERLLCSQAAALFQSRLQSLFFLSLTLIRVPTSEMNWPLFYKGKAKKPRKLTKKWLKTHAKNMCAEREKKRKELKEERHTHATEGNDEGDGGDCDRKRKASEDEEEERTRSEAASESISGRERGRKKRRLTGALAT